MLVILSLTGNMLSCNLLGLAQSQIITGILLKDLQKLANY